MSDVYFFSYNLTSLSLGDGLREAFFAFKRDKEGRDDFAQKRGTRNLWNQKLCGA